MSFLGTHAASRCCSAPRWHHSRTSLSTSLCLVTGFPFLPPQRLFQGQTCHLSLKLLSLAVTFQLLVPPLTCTTQLQGNPCPKTPWKLILELRSDYFLLLRYKPNAVLRTIQGIGILRRLLKLCKRCFGFLHLTTNLTKNNEAELFLFKVDTLHPYITPSFEFQCRDHLSTPLQRGFKFKPFVGQCQWNYLHL